MATYMLRSSASMRWCTYPFLSSDEHASSNDDAYPALTSNRIKKSATIGGKSSGKLLGRSRWREWPLRRLAVDMSMILITLITWPRTRWVFPKVRLQNGWASGEASDSGL